ERISDCTGLPVPWSPGGSVRTRVEEFKQAGLGVGVPEGVGVPPGTVAVAVGVAVGVPNGVTLGIAVAVGEGVGARGTHCENLKLPMRVCQGALGSGMV